MPTYTLADLSTEETAAVIRARMVAGLAARGLPTSDWAPTAAGGVENAVLDAVSGCLAKYAAPLVPKILALGLLGKATGDVLSYRAKHYYRLDRDEATKTRQTIRLTSTAEAPTYTLAPGDIVVVGLTGNVYVSIDGGQLVSGAGTAPDKPALFVTVEAQEAGAAFSDSDGTIDSSNAPQALITPLPGVTAINLPETDFTDPKLLGSSAGTLAAAFTAAGIPPHGYDTVRVRIDTAGDVGTGTWSYLLDPSQPWVSGGAIAATATIPGGTTVHFANAPGVSPSFLAGDSWSFAAAHAIVVQGHDEETDAALIQRCEFRWPALSEVPTEAKMALWAHRASPEVGKIIADADPSRSGQTLIVVAGVAGTVASSTASTVQDFINARLNGYQGIPQLQETAVVVAATERPITAGGIVTVKRNLLSSVRPQAEKLWRAYLASVGLASRVYRAELVEAVMDAGAFEITVPTLNGAAVDYVQLGDREVAVEAPGTSLLTSLSWVPI